MPSSIIGAVAGPIIGSILSGGGSSGGGGGGGGPTTSAAQDQAALTSAAATRQQSQIAQDQWDYYKNNYQPLEGTLIDQAMIAGSPEEFAKARGRANADVAGAFDAAQKQTQSRLQSYGINPASPAYQSAAGSVDLAQGAARVGALTAADNNTQGIAYSRALDMAGMGRNIPAQSAASAANAANGATAAGQLALSANRLGYDQNQTNMKNAGYAMAPITKAVSGAAGNWFKGGNSTPDYSGYAPATYGPQGSYADNPFQANEAMWADGGEVTRYQKGGMVSTQPEKFAEGGNVGFGNLGIYGLDNLERPGYTNIANPGLVGKPAQLANGQDFERLMPVTPWSITRGPNQGYRRPQATQAAAPQAAAQPAQPSGYFDYADPAYMQRINEFISDTGAGRSGGAITPPWKEGVPPPQSQASGNVTGPLQNWLGGVKSAMSGYKDGGTITPHMRRFAGGGGIEPQESAPNDASEMGKLSGPGTETSDSIPAMIDGDQPAALSTNEVVMNAEVPKMSGEEILAALNKAGLQKRRQGIEPANEEDAQNEQQAYRKGGKVKRYANGGSVCYAKFGLGG